MMSIMRPASAVLDEEFLPVRAKLLEIASSLDRIDRANGETIMGDPRIAQVHTAIETLLSAGPDRTEEIQLIFSLDYEESWLEKYRLAHGR